MKCRSSLIGITDDKLENDSPSEAQFAQKYIKYNNLTNKHAIMAPYFLSGSKTGAFESPLSVWGNLGGFGAAILVGRAERMNAVGLFLCGTGKVRLPRKSTRDGVLKTVRWTQSYMRAASRRSARAEVRRDCLRTMRSRIGIETQTVRRKRARVAAV